jgi:hypothetical protein
MAALWMPATSANEWVLQLAASHPWGAALVGAVFLSSLVYLGRTLIRERRQRVALQGAAAELGLTRKAKRAVGRLDGLPIELNAIGPVRDVAPFLACIALLAHPDRVLITLPVGVMLWAGWTRVRSRFASARHSTCVELRADGPWDPRIAVHHPTDASRWVGPGVVTGDPRLDDCVRLVGAEPEVLAVLTPEVRVKLEGLVEQGLTLNRGEALLRVEVTDAADLVRATRAFVAVLDSLGRAVQQTPTLSERVLVDPEPGVRARALEVLALSHDAGQAKRVAQEVLAEHGVTSDDADALVAALTGPPVLVRAAVLALGEHGQGSHVPSLRALQSPDGGPLDRLVGSTIAIIQNRIGHAAGGRVSLSGITEEGRLSLSGATEGGRVSVCEADSLGQVSALIAASAGASPRARVGDGA